jgi:HSP20 family molecular chaperone IbpA
MKSETSENYVYPGEFVSMADDGSVIERSMNTPDNDFATSYVNVKELVNEYKIEVAVPGIEKEQLILFSDNNLLLICASNNAGMIRKEKTFQRHIHLPGDADAELAVAEFRHNTLYCYVPKTKAHMQNRKGRIIVY